MESFANLLKRGRDFVWRCKLNFWIPSIFHVLNSIRESNQVNGWGFGASQKNVCRKWKNDTRPFLILTKVMGNPGFWCEMTRENLRLFDDFASIDVSKRTKQNLVWKKMRKVKWFLPFLFSLTVTCLSFHFFHPTKRIDFLPNLVNLRHNNTTAYTILSKHIVNSVYNSSNFAWGGILRVNNNSTNTFHFQYAFSTHSPLRLRKIINILRITLQ